MLLLAGAARLMLGGSLVRRRCKVLIAAASTAAFGDNEAVSRPGEIVQQLAGVRVVDDGAHRNGQFHGFPVAASALAPFAVTAALRRMFRIEPKMKQRIVVLARNHHHIAAMPAVAAARAAARHELLAPES